MNAPATRPPWPDRSPGPSTEERSDLSGDQARPWLSALVDGDASAVQQACDAWRGDAQARADWHTYHLIGDVMRSDDLAADPAGDAQFLARLRLRLAEEPVPLAPEPDGAITAPRRRRTAWLVPMAAAAGVAAVAGVLVLTQVDPQASAPSAGWALNGPALSRQDPGPVPAPDLAPERRATAATGLERLANAGTGAGEGTAGNVGNASARLLRDARLDHYLEAHRGALGAAVAVPGGAMRNAEVIVPAPEPR